MNASSQASQRRCQQCGAPLESGGAAEVCLGCALEHALEPTASPEAASVLPQNATAASSIARNPLLGRFGDYELLEEIARGGMGVVFKARQVSLDRLVAVKMLLFGPLASAETVQRFRTEAAAAASLQHPKIVAVHEVGFRDGQHFIAMDYVAGRSLAELVREGPLPPHRAAGYVKTIAEAIHFAHERNILHRDLKPSNVLIGLESAPAAGPKDDLPEVLGKGAGPPLPDRAGVGG
ncbi:MAG: serine/threonine protein kinase [Verrucomicrobiales bacterium]|nr:serine/threonine protein kinase [Verrucomicrobiales bacterium]